jgi:hypothetical protein
VPHRSSRLTAVLRDALGGNCRTTLVANIWGEARHVEETVSTLKFALRMQNVRAPPPPATHWLGLGLGSDANPNPNPHPNPNPNPNPNPPTLTR